MPDDRGKDVIGSPAVSKTDSGHAAITASGCTRVASFLEVKTEKLSCSRIYTVLAFRLTGTTRSFVAAPRFATAAVAASDALLGEQPTPAEWLEARALLTSVAGPITPIVSVNQFLINYGTVLTNNLLSGSATATVSGQNVNVPGAFTFDTVAGTVPHAGTITEGVTFTPTDATDYHSLTVNVNVSITPATPTLSVDPVVETYGATTPTGFLSGTATIPYGGQSASVGGGIMFCSQVPPLLGVGQYTESVHFLPYDTIDFYPVLGTVSITVNPATPTVSVNPVTINNGTALANSQLSGTATWTVNGQLVNVPGMFRYTNAAGTILGPGTGLVVGVTFTPTDSADYASETVEVLVNVLTVPVTAAPPISLPSNRH